MDLVKTTIPVLFHDKYWLQNLVNVYLSLKVWETYKILLFLSTYCLLCPDYITVRADVIS